MNTTVKGFTNKKIINQEAAQWILLLEDTPKLSRVYGSIMGRNGSLI